MNADVSTPFVDTSRTSDNSSGDNEGRALSLLQKIQAGLFDPKCIRPEERRLVVAYLMADGYGTAEMAQILKVSDRSIERDKKAIREANTITADPQLVEQMVGRLILEADQSIQRIRKAVRDKETPHAVRVDAEYKCFQIANDLMMSLQRLGYLPTATARLQADITHSISHVPGLSDIEHEYQRLKRICGESQDANPQLIERFKLLQTKIERVALASELTEVSNLLMNKGENNESD